MAAIVDLTATDCWCGLPFALPTRLYEQCRKTGRTFHCPLGHSIVFRETEADKYRREADRLKQRVAQKDDDIHREREWREAAERRASAMKGQVTKLKNRAAAGSCPCCKRNFQNLARHMKSKHPDFAKEPLAVVEGGKVA